MIPNCLSAKSACAYRVKWKTAAHAILSSITEQGKLTAELVERGENIRAPEPRPGWKICTCRTRPNAVTKGQIA